MHLAQFCSGASAALDGDNQGHRLSIEYLIQMNLLLDSVVEDDEIFRREPLTSFPLPSFTSVGADTTVVCARITGSCAKALPVSSKMVMNDKIDGQRMTFRLRRQYFGC